MRYYLFSDTILSILQYLQLRMNIREILHLVCGEIIKLFVFCDL